jgi:hypothetical protein
MTKRDEPSRSHGECTVFRLTRTRRLTSLLIGGLAVALTISHPLAGSAAQARVDKTSAITFRGNGGKSLPPFRVSRSSTLFWTSGGSVFQIFSTGLGGGTVNSQARSGWTYMPPARYRLDVNAIGNWRIRVIAGVVRPQRMAAGWIGYRGNGGLDLPPFVTRRGTTLRWTSSGSIFQVFSKEFSGGGDVNSQAHRGSTYLEKGKHTLTINALGAWTIAWRP